MQVVKRPIPKCSTRGAYAMVIALLAIAMLAFSAAADAGDETRSTVAFGPDLAVNAGDMTLSKTSLLAGVEFNVSIKVYNLGDEDATNVDVDLLVDTQPVSRVTLNKVTVDSWDIVEFELALSQGDHEIAVLVDADDAIDERREDNNDATLQVKVRGLPDASIRAEDITVSDAHPMEGDVLSIDATIHNLGESAATLVVVQFWDGPPDKGALIANRTTSVPEGGQSLVTTIWDTTGLGGTHMVNVVIDRVMPGEDNVDNNLAIATVLVFTHWDLVIDTNTSDVTIDQVWTQDGFVTIRDGTVLTISGITFEFLQDYDNQFALFVEDGGRLVLDDAIVRSTFDLQVFLEDGTSLLLTSGSELTADVMMSGDVDITIKESLLIGDLKGSASTITITDSVISGGLDLGTSRLDIENTGIFASGPCMLTGTRAVFVDTTFNGSAGTSLVLYEGAIVELRNVICSGVTTDATSKALVYRRLEVQVVDESGMVIPGADIEVRHFVNGTVIGTTTGGDDGRAIVEILSDVIEGGESHFIGNYKVWASFSGKEGITSLLLTPFPDMGTSANLPMSSVVLPPVEPRDMISSTPGDMMIDAGENMTLVADFVQDGNIVVRGDLTVTTASLSILQDRGHHFYVVVEGNGRLTLMAAELTSEHPLNVYLYDDATLEMGPGSALFVNALVAEDGATVMANGAEIDARLLLRGGQVSLRNGCSLTGDLVVIEAPLIEFATGSIDVGEMRLDSPAVSIEDIDLSVDDLYLHASFANFTGCNVMVSTMTAETIILTVTDTQITAEEPLNLTVATYYMDSSSSNVAFYSARPDSKVYLYDADVPRPFSLGNATVMVYWYLTVVVEDLLANPVAGSDVVVKYTSNDTVVASGVTNDDGQVRFPLLGSIVGTEGEYFVGNYMVAATSPKDPEDVEISFVNLDRAKTLRIGFPVTMVPPASIGVEIYVTNTTIVAGTEFIVAGTATAIYPTVRSPLDQGDVTIELWTNGSTWSNTTTLATDGTFSFNIPAPIDDGVYYLRAIVTPTGDYEVVPPGTSNRITLDLTAPGPTSLYIVLNPNKIMDFAAGSTLVVRGWVKYNTAQGAPAANVRVFLEDPVNMKTYQTQADGLGVFEFPARPGPSFEGQADYFLTAKDEDLDIETPEKFRLVVYAVKPPEVEEEDNRDLLLWSIIIIVIVVVAVVGTLGYWAFSSKGRMVECGECGTLVPETALECPKCGTEFEVEVAKCSVCESWIKSDATVCPYCNTPFIDLEGMDVEEGAEASEGEGGGAVIAEVPDEISPMAEVVEDGVEGSPEAIKQVPEGLKKEVRPRPVVQKRAVKEMPGDIENGGHVNGDDGQAPRPRVVKKVPAPPQELEQELIMEDPGEALDLTEEEEES